MPFELQLLLRMLIVPDQMPKWRESQMKGLLYLYFALSCFELECTNHAKIHLFLNQPNFKLFYTFSLFRTMWPEYQ